MFTEPFVYEELNRPLDEYDFAMGLEGYQGSGASIVEMIYGVDLDNEDGTYTKYRIEDDPYKYNNSEQSEFEALSRWTDRDPNERTAVMDWWYVTPTTIQSGTYATTDARTVKPSYAVSTGDRTAYVEGTDGFITRQLIDPYATERLQWRMLNNFINKKTGLFHVGSVAFSFEGSTVIATCVNPDCNRRCEDGVYRRAAFKLDRSVVDRPAMEAFVYACIKHGNNHGPSWLVTRPDFYLMHDVDCSLKHDGIACDHKRSVTDVLVTEMDDVTFVMEHQMYCNDRKCGCSEWLANEVPSLVKESV